MVVEILRLGIYQIIYMDKVPESAAVNESVKLAKKLTRGLSGLRKCHIEIRYTRTR